MAEPMRIRATMAGDVADVKVLMNHPMETGLRKDAKTGQLVPAHFIQDVTATINGAAVLNADFGTGISKNPYLGFKVKGPKKGDRSSSTGSTTKATRTPPKPSSVDAFAHIGRGVDGSLPSTPQSRLRRVSALLSAQPGSCE